MNWSHKRRWRWLGVGLAVLLIAAAAVKLLLPAEKIRDLALDQARTALGRDVSVGEVSVSLRGGLGVRLADFVIANPDDFDGADFLTTEAIDLKLALKPLFKGAFRVDRLVIEGPSVHLIRLADGRDNFTFAPPATTTNTTGTADSVATTTAPPLSVARLTINHGSLFFSDQGAAAPALQAVRVDGLSLGLSLTDPEPGHYDIAGRLAAETVALTGPEGVPELQSAVDFDLSWDVGASVLDLKRVMVRVLDIPLDCTGRITIEDGAPSGGIEVHVTNLALVDLGRFLPPGQSGRLAGWAELDVSFSNTAENPTVIDYQGTATVREVSFTNSGLVDDLQDLRATLNFTPDKFTVENCRAEFGAGTFDLTGSLQDPFPYFLPPEMQKGVEMKTPRLEFSLQTATLDVDRWLPAASPASEAVAGESPPPREIPAGTEFPDLICEGTFAADSLLYMQVPLTGVRGAVSLRDRRLSVHDVTGGVYHGTVNGQVDIDLNDLRNPVYEGTYAAQDIEVDNFATRFAGLAGVVFGGCNLQGGFAANGLDPVAIRNSLTLKADADIARGKVVTSGSTYQALNKLAGQVGQTLDQEQSLRDLATHIRVDQGRVHLNALTTRLGQIGDVRIDGYYSFNGDLNYNGSLLLTKAQTDGLFSGGLLGELGKLLGSQRPDRLELPLSVAGTRSKPRVQLDLGKVVHDLQQRAAQEQGDKLEDEARHKLGDLLKKWK